MRNLKFFVLGAPRVGKTTILHQMIFGDQSREPIHTKKFPPTIEDVYFAIIDPGLIETSNGRNSSNLGATNGQTMIGNTNSVREERIMFFDVAGIENNIDIETVRNYVSSADGFILIYSINDRQTFTIIDNVKKLIDQSKDKRGDIPIIALGNKLDRDDERQVDFDEALVWAKREHVKLFEVTAMERQTLAELLVYLAARLTSSQAQTTSSFKLRRSKTGSSAGS